MQGIAIVVDNAAQQGAFERQQAAPVQADPVVKNLFLLLQGSYGSLFLSKYATGVKDDAGRDLGIRATMKVWSSALCKYPADVVEAAAARLTREHPEFPPNLPQFVSLCDACMPVKTYAQEQGWKALPAPTVQPIRVDLRMHNDGKDWARNLVARAQHGDKSVRPISLRFAQQALGMEGRQTWQ